MEVSEIRNHNVKVYIIFTGNGGFRNHNVKVYSIFAGNRGFRNHNVKVYIIWGLGVGGGLSKGCF